jgi:cell division protein FtsQ
MLVTVIGGAAIADQRGLLDRDRIATALGFGIEQVSLTGHRFTSDADLFDALDLKSARSLVSFDAEIIRKRFERLPWVQSVDISRVWPGQLAIRVSERKAFAVWEEGDAAQLIDVTGRILGPVKRDAPLDLPRIAGEDANAAAALLFTALDRNPLIKARVVRAVRLGGRRWTLELSGGGRIHLPSDGEASALARLAADPQLVAMVEASELVIDLRSTSRIAFRTAGPATGAAGGGM